ARPHRSTDLVTIMFPLWGAAARPLRPACRRVGDVGEGRCRCATRSPHPEVANAHAACRTAPTQLRRPDGGHRENDAPDQRLLAYREPDLGGILGLPVGEE